MKPTTRLFVANLPENITDEDLILAFSFFGKVTNLDLNVKTEAGKECTKFAFVSLSALRVDVESCIQHFKNEDFHGNRLYIIEARESFLERLQREQDEAQKQPKDDKVKFMCQESVHQKNLVLRLHDIIYSEELNRSAKWSWRTSEHCHLMLQQNVENKIPMNLSKKLNPRKRKIEHNHAAETELKTRKHKAGKVLNEGTKIKYSAGDKVENKMKNTRFVTADRNKREAKKKLLESMNKKRQIFKEKEPITTSMTSVDEVQNKRATYPDFDDLLKKLKDNDKKVSRQITIHWIRVYQNTRILHRHKQDLMHTHISLATVLRD